MSKPLPPPPPPPAEKREPTAAEVVTHEMRRSYAAISDPHVDLYQMLHVDYRASITEIDQAIKQAIRWWNGQQANPKYRYQAPEALRRLQEARQTLLDPLRRQEYDRSLQAFRSTHREIRWQPIRDLADVLFLQTPVRWEQEQLLKRYAAKRGLDEGEIERLLHEEYLRRNLEKPTPPTPPIRSEAHFAPGYRLASGLMLLSLGGLLALSFSTHPRSSVLLMVPFLNNLRLFVRGLYTAERLPEDTGAWEWLVGIAVLGGATLTALADLHASLWLPAGLGISSLIWGVWLYLGWLWRQTPLRP